MTHSVDILIIGSGPIGATFAHGLAERMPTAHILMLDAGPQLTSKAGLHVANIADKQARTQAQIRSQGPSQYPYETSSIAERATATHEKGLRRISRLARPGTHLATLDDAELDVSGLPAAGRRRAHLVYPASRMEQPVRASLGTVECDAKRLLGVRSGSRYPKRVGRGV